MLLSSIDSGRGEASPCISLLAGFSHSTAAPSPAILRLLRIRALAPQWEKPSRASPVIRASGRAVMPGDFVSMSGYGMPQCFGASGSVRTRQNIQSAICAFEVQTFGR
jgi:hypothetical protein